MLVQVYTNVGRHKLSLGRKLFKNDPCKQSRRQKDLRGGRGGRENTTSTLQHQQSTVLQLGGLLLYFHGGTINSTAAVNNDANTCISTLTLSAILRSKSSLFLLLADKYLGGRGPQVSGSG